VTFYVSAFLRQCFDTWLGDRNDRWVAKKPVPIIARDSFTEQADWQRTGKFMYLGQSCTEVQTSGVM